MRKIGIAKPLLALLAAGMLLAGCGSSGGGSSAKAFTITADDAPGATFTTMSGANTAQTLFWSTDEMWDYGGPARVPAKAKTPVSPLGLKMREIAAQARASGGISPTVAIPTDTVVGSWCGSGYATINGTFSVSGRTLTTAITAVFTDFDQCYGAVLNGDATIHVTAVDEDDGDDYIDTVDVSMTMDDLSIFSYPGQTLVMNGTLTADGNYHTEIYNAELDASATDGEMNLRFSNFKVHFDESDWPAVDATIEGTIYADGEYVKVTTPVELWFNDIEAARAPDGGVVEINGNGLLTVSFSNDESGQLILLELDGNEDGDVLDTGDWSIGPMNWDEFFALLGLE